MTRRARAALATLVTAAAAAAAGALTQVPYQGGRGEAALIRLSWRARGTRIEECRPLSDAERRRRPAHMRQDEICEGRVLPYRLTVLVDGHEVIARSVEAAGARHDRPLYVFQEIPVAPGRHVLEVAFVLAGEVAPDTALPAPPTPHSLTLRETIVLGPSEVALLTYDPDRRELSLRGYGRAPAAGS